MVYDRFAGQLKLFKIAPGDFVPKYTKQVQHPVTAVIFCPG